MALQRTEAGDGGVHRPGCGLVIGERGESGGERAFGVVGDDLVDEAAYGGAVLDRVETAAADELVDLRLDRVSTALTCEPYSTMSTCG